MWVVDFSFTKNVNGIRKQAGFRWVQGLGHCNRRHQVRVWIRYMWSSVKNHAISFFLNISIIIGTTTKYTYQCVWENIFLSYSDLGLTPFWAKFLIGEMLLIGGGGTVSAFCYLYYNQDRNCMASVKTNIFTYLIMLAIFCLVGVLGIVDDGIKWGWFWKARKAWVKTNTKNKFCLV